MKRRFGQFLQATEGAVTVEWVVLTGAVIGLGMLALFPVAFQADSMADNVGTSIGSMPAGYGNQ